MIKLTVRPIKVYDSTMWGVFLGESLVANSERWSERGAINKKIELERRLNGGSK